jgi:hypothetical protein
VGDEALRMLAGEHDAGDRRVGLGATDEALEPVDDTVVHEPVRRVADRRQQDAFTALVDSYLAHAQFTDPSLIAAIFR